MEQFFEITKDASVFAEYWVWKKNEEASREAAKAFLKDHGIEATKYRPTPKALQIVATRADIQNFGGQFLSKNLQYGLREFKKTSPIGSAWAKMCADNNACVIMKPYVPFFFVGANGSNRTRIFDVDGRVYCSIERDGNPLDCPQGFVEMKGSDFWAVMESDEK